MVEISVIIPIKDAESTITNTIHSIVKSAGSLELEIIVVDDSSSDASFATVKNLSYEQVVLMKNEGSGIANALNSGLCAARGRYIARCDADDFFSPDRLLLQWQWLETHPEFGAICGRFAAIEHEKGPIITLGSEDRCEISKELRNGITRTSLCTFLIRKNAAKSTGSFRPFFIISEDIDYQLRLGENTRVYYQPRIEYYYRLHETSVTHSSAPNQRTFFDNCALQFQKERKKMGQDSLQKDQAPIIPQPINSPKKQANTHFYNLLEGSIWKQYACGNKQQAIKQSLTLLKKRWWKPSAWKIFLTITARSVRK